ncbi:MAG: hypothetical protein U0984_19160 [Prosthecobacter sp.]|nr:hypothetical protein [Prosthecobacter sp.]
MPSIEANSTRTTASLTCPLCGSPLSPENPNACTHCDWVAGAESDQNPQGSVRDKVAVALSVIPGLGHIYKGHRLTGALYMLGAAFAIFAAIVASTATAGFGILLLPLYWLGIMLQVYFVEDLVVLGPKRK